MTKNIIKKILIANRGEIALRIIKTAQRMNIQCVAVYSLSDQDSLHIRAADEAYSLNADKAADSYLNIEKIINIAQQSGCDAIHPGYGFLAENALFSKACADHNIIFIGPRAETIALMGDKASAKAFSKAQGIPVIPGEENLEQDLATFQKHAQQIGTPLLLKASAGGGGKGMKLVHDLKEVESAYLSAKRESLASFGNDNLIIEKYFEKARHIEIQVLADQHGNVLHLYDRDCSLQRRHQKIIEEAPAYGLSDACRSAMQTSAIKLCKAIQYQGAGTLEFLLDENENFYLMEMNTRLQVEHAVSEQITGIDLVEQQILIAQGETLTLKQSDIKISGHSIEARIYAEQCKNNFLPASGTIEYLHLPKETLALRIDHALHNQQVISSLYDPMIGKVACWSADRNSAIHALHNALSNVNIIGLETNRNFLKACLAHADFINGNISTKFIEQHLTALNVSELSGLAELAASLFSLSQKAFSFEIAKSFKQQHSPWLSNDNWRLNTKADNNFVINFEDKELSALDYKKFSDLRTCELNVEVLTHNLNSNTLIASWQQINNRDLSGLLKFKKLSGSAALAQLNISGNTGDFKLEISNISTQKIMSSHINSDINYLAPLNGRVIAVNAHEGDAVEQGQEIVILEAMKMEHILKARTSGVLNLLKVKVDQQVEADSLLFQIEATDNQ